MSEPREVKLIRENYPPNKGDGDTEKEQVSKKKVEKVIQGSVVRKKKSALRKAKDEIIKTDLGTAMRYVCSEILIPASKELVYNMIAGGTEMAFWGESRGRRSRSRDDRGRVSYERMYDRDRDYDRDRSSSRSRGRRDFDDIIFDTKGEAETVLCNMVDLIEDYGQVTVHDFFDLVGEDCDYTEDKYGWTNLRTAYVERGRGGWYINLPRARAID